jgi:hypothetical protein
MKDIAWKILARAVAHPRVANWLIRRSQRTPYAHLPGYMRRFWVFNGYDHETRVKRFPRLPSIRIHHILREDSAKHLHDHPWQARTIILCGEYVETRLDAELSDFIGADVHVVYRRNPGDTAALSAGEFHRIDSVSAGGVWTLFITWAAEASWGFLVDGKWVDRRDYKGRM